MKKLNDFFLKNFSSKKKRIFKILKTDFGVGAVGVGGEGKEEVWVGAVRVGMVRLPGSVGARGVGLEGWGA